MAVIYFLSRADVGYDETSDVLIIADSEQQARQIAHDETSGNESKDIWLSWPGVAAKELGVAYDSKPRMISESVAYG